MQQTTTRVILTRRPTDTATPHCFEAVTQPLGPLESGQVRVNVEFISVDAGTRIMLRGEGFHQHVGVGETVRASGVGRRT
jgi:NADPH-dependent curcumin reductase CurA